eukprot:773814_1
MDTQNVLNIIALYCLLSPCTVFLIAFYFFHLIVASIYHPAASSPDAICYYLPHVCVLLLRCILYGNPYIFDEVCYTIFHGVSCVSYRSGLLDDAVVISRDILCEIHPILDASMGFAFQQNYLIYLYPSYRPLFFFESLVMGNAMMI